MIRKTKKSAWAVIAALALVALMATPASADEFDSEASHTIWSGSQVTEGGDVYTFNVGTWKCNTRTYSGTSSTSTGTTVSLSPSVAQCTTFGFINGVLDANGCQYQYHTKKEGSSSQELRIICPEGASMVITTMICHVTIPAQSGLTGITYTSEGSGKSRDVKIDHSISNLKYTQTSKSFPGCTNGSFTNGTISATTTLKALNTAGEQVGVSVFSTAHLEETEHAAKTAHETKTAHEAETAHIAKTAHEAVTAHDAETAHEAQTEDESAPKGEFHAEAAHVLLSGSATGEYQAGFNVGIWKCTGRSDSGTTTTATSTTLQVSPGFSGCTAWGFINQPIDLNGCSFQYHTNKEGVSSQGMSIACGAGQSITITGFNCHVTIPAQSGLNSVTYTNEGSGKSRDIKISHSIKGLSYTQTSKSWPGCTSGSFTNGTYSGTTTLKATNTAAEQVGVWFQ